MYTSLDFLFCKLLKYKVIENKRKNIRLFFFLVIKNAILLIGDNNYDK